MSDIETKDKKKKVEDEDDDIDDLGGFIGCCFGALGGV